MARMPENLARLTHHVLGWKYTDWGIGHSKYGPRNDPFFSTYFHLVLTPRPDRSAPALKLIGALRNAFNERGLSEHGPYHGDYNFLGPEEARQRLREQREGAPVVVVLGYSPKARTVLEGMTKKLMALSKEPEKPRRLL